MSPLSITNKTFWKVFFPERERINSKLVYAVPKLNLIQKGTGGQSHHLPCLIRQIIAKIVSTPMHTGTKVGDTDNSIYQELWCTSCKNCLVRPSPTITGPGRLLPTGSHRPVWSRCPRWDLCRQQSFDTNHCHMGTLWYTQIKNRRT